MYIFLLFLESLFLCGHSSLLPHLCDSFAEVLHNGSTHLFLAAGRPLLAALSDSVLAADRDVGLFDVSQLLVSINRPAETMT